MQHSNKQQAPRTPRFQGYCALSMSSGQSTRLLNTRSPNMKEWWSSTSPKSTSPRAQPRSFPETWGRLTLPRWGIEGSLDADLRPGRRGSLPAPEVTSVQSHCACLKNQHVHRSVSTHPSRLKRSEGSAWSHPWCGHPHPSRRSRSPAKESRQPANLSLIT